MHYDREIPLIDLAPGDAKKPHQVCLVCAYPTNEKHRIERRINEKFGTEGISIQSLSQEGIIICNIPSSRVVNSEYGKRSSLYYSVYTIHRLLSMSKSEMDRLSIDENGRPQCFNCRDSRVRIDRSRLARAHIARTRVCYI